MSSSSSVNLDEGRQYWLAHSSIAVIIGALSQLERLIDRKQTAILTPQPGIGAEPAPLGELGELAYQRQHITMLLQSIYDELPNEVYCCEGWLKFRNSFEQLEEPK
jgi:hypothetical protein